MKHKDLLAAVRQETGLGAEQATSLAADMVSAVTNILAQGDSLTIQGFGTFETRRKEARLSVNPATGKRFIVPPKVVPVFRPGVTLKDKIKGYKG